MQTQPIKTLDTRTTNESSAMTMTSILQRVNARQTVDMYQQDASELR